MHALDRLNEQRIRILDVRQAIANDAPEVIENYPTHARGPCCLVLCFTPTGDPYHVVCTHPPDVWVVTVYYPDDRWTPDFKRRRTDI